MTGGRRREAWREGGEENSAAEKFNHVHGPSSLVRGKAFLRPPNAFLVYL